MVIDDFKVNTRYYERLVLYNTITNCNDFAYLQRIIFMHILYFR